MHVIFYLKMYLAFQWNLAVCNVYQKWRTAYSKLNTIDSVNGFQQRHTITDFFATVEGALSHFFIKKDD